MRELEKIGITGRLSRPKSAIDLWEQRPATFVPVDKQNPPSGDAKR